ncbi:MAG TPA: hypothetical protein VJZ71_09220 [Phycisphaerae bacterium]|nr:hypothetical protein [Phycisphaerae bacterium]
MNKRPHSLTIIGWVFVGVGAIGLVRGAWSLTGIAQPWSGMDAKTEPLRDAVYVIGSGLMAGVGGEFALRGRNWARWLLVAWMGFHIVLSLFHSATELAVHGALFAVIMWFLFRPRETAYFRGARPERGSSCVFEE